MTESPTLLAVLLESRGLDRYGSFRAAYQKAARTVDQGLADSAPSRAQFHRWITGGLRGLPYTDHCRVLEHMLDGYTATQLLAACPDRAIPAPARVGNVKPGTHAPQPDSKAPILADMAGVEAIFASRSEFAARVEPQALFEGVSSIRAVGLSLNLICQ